MQRKFIKTILIFITLIMILSAVQIPAYASEVVAPDETEEVYVSEEIQTEAGNEAMTESVSQTSGDLFLEEKESAENGWKSVNVKAEADEWEDTKFRVCFWEYDGSVPEKADEWKEYFIDPFQDLSFNGLEALNAEFYGDYDESGVIISAYLAFTVPAGMIREEEIQIYAQTESSLHLMLEAVCNDTVTDYLPLEWPANEEKHETEESDDVVPKDDSQEKGSDTYEAIFEEYATDSADEEESDDELMIFSDFKAEDDEFELITEFETDDEFELMTESETEDTEFELMTENYGIATLSATNNSSQTSSPNKTVSVKDYGADGSDKKDDTTAIQNALKEAQNVKGTLTVNVPSGTYYISKALNIYSNTKFVLNSKAKIVRTDDSKVMLKAALCDSSDGKGYNRTSNITVEGGTWDGNAGGTVDSNLFYICHSKNLTFKNFTIQNCCGTHHIEIAGCKDVTFSNVTFKNYVINKNNPISSLCGEALQMDYCNQNTSGGGSPFDNTTCQNITVNNCTFTDCWSGAGSHHTDYQSKNYVFTNNTFKNMKGHCIRIPYVSGATVKNNTATNVHTFCYVEGKSTNVAISGNTATCNNSSGLKDSNSYGVLSNNSTVTVSNNTFKNALNHGISAKSGGSITVKNNTISSPAGNGIIVDGANLNASGNTISSAGNNGISVKNKSSESTAKNNTINSPKSNGIAITNATVSLSGNKINKAGSKGIYGSNAGGTISSNTVENSGSAGIYMSNSSKSMTIKSNTVKTTNTHGIGLSGANATVSNNTISNTGTNGIYTSGSACKVESNSLSSIGTNGISVKDNGTGTVKNNTIKATGSHGIYIDNAGITASGNKISNAGKQGIYGNVASGSIKNSTIEKTGSAGIYIKESTSNITVSENTIKTCGTHGVAVVSGKGSVKNNKISGCQANGIYTQNGTLTASGNTVSESGKNGIYSDGSNVKINGNSISGSGKYDYKTNDKSSGTVKYVCAKNLKVKNGTSKVKITASHSYQWKISKKSSYGKTGKKYQQCSRCGSRKNTKTISAKASSYLWPGISKTTKISQTISWDKVNGATKYAVYGAKCGSSYKKLKETTGTSIKITGRKPGTSYKYYVVAYIGNERLTKSYSIHGSTSGGKYGNPEAIKISKTSVSIKKGKTKRISASVSSGKTMRSCVDRIRYYSSSNSIAKVDSEGKITAVKKGTCNIYAVAQNGKYKTIKVTVK